MKSNRQDKSATVVTIGRNQGNSLVFESRLVSEWHANIVIQDDFYYLKDLNSESGTWVNGKRVKTVPLKDGDVIHFGSEQFSFIFCMEPDEPAAPADSPQNEAEKKIDLTSLAQAKKKIDWRKQLGVSASNIIPFVNEPRPPAGKGDADTLKAVPPKDQTAARQDPPSPAPLDKNPSRLWPLARHPLFHIACFAILFGVGSSLHSHLVGHRAYDAGYEYGLKEFATPPRDLNIAIIEKFAQPEAFKRELKPSAYEDFVKGIEDASFKTYVARFHSPPHHFQR